MNSIRFVVVFAIALSMSVYADSAPDIRRDRAIEKINACLRRNETSSRQCKKLNENVETLVDVYKGGDKSVLPTLFQFTYLTDFYGDALLSDPDVFLMAMAKLPRENQQAVAVGIAGGMFRLPSKERFEAIRALLTRVPESSPAEEVAQTCLKVLEVNNASFFMNYFPPQTLASAAADLQVSWYSRDMYMLGEKPLWPPSSNSEAIYRFTYLGAFTYPKAITLTVQPDSTGRINMRVISETRKMTQLDDTAVPQDQLARFLTQLDQAAFWDMPTELPRRGKDGAEWILEGVQNGRYHIVVRWCPDVVQQSIGSGLRQGSAVVVRIRRT